MNELRRGLDQIDPSILMLGEGWHLHTPLWDDLKASQRNAHAMPRIAHFNDAYRDALKGSAFFGPDQGFVSNKGFLEQEMKKGIAGGIFYGEGIGTFAHEPNQTVTYAEAHDNLTLWDKLALSMAWAPEEERRQAHRLVSSMLLTSQGIPFIHAGQEFMRTKGGDHNSYRSPAEVNWLDWRRRAERSEDVEHVKRLIALRKAHPGFRMPTAEMIRRHLVFEPSPGGGVAYTIRDHANGDSAKHLFVFHNANGYETEVAVPRLGSWEPLFGEAAVLWSWDGGLKAAPRSTVVLQCRD
jgi:pullulanase/glycogen debranching enzyme